MQFDHGAIECGEELRSGGGESHQDAASILTLTIAAHQAVTLQPIQQSGHVGHLGDHIRGDLGGAATGAARAPKDPQNVVARGRDSVGPEEPIKGHRQNAGGAHHVQERLLLGEVEGVPLVDFLSQGGHGWSWCWEDDCLNSNRENGEVKNPLAPAACDEEGGGVER